MLYKVKRFDLWVARRFIKAKYISLVNLLADDEVFPEYLTWRDVSDELVRWAMAWLDDSEARSRTTAALATLRDQVARPGASDRAAQCICEWIAQHRQVASAPRAYAPLTPHSGPHELVSNREHSGESQRQTR